MLKIGLEEEIKGVSEHWNKEMPIMAMEEAAEFAHALSKYVRWQGRTDDVYLMYEKRTALIDEIGDMYISLGAIMHTCGISKEEVETRIVTKLQKKF